MDLLLIDEPSEKYYVNEDPNNNEQIELLLMVDWLMDPKNRF